MVSAPRLSRPTSPSDDSPASRPRGRGAAGVLFAFTLHGNVSQRRGATPSEIYCGVVGGQLKTASTFQTEMLPGSSFPGRPARRPQWTHPQLARSQAPRRPVLWFDPALSQAGPPQAQQLPIEGNRGALAVIDPNGPASRPGKASLPTDNESQDCKRRATRVSLGALSAVMSRDSFGAPGAPPCSLLQSPAGSSLGRNDGGVAPYERAAKRPCVSHAPAASPGRAALPCSPAAPCAAPGLGERRMARPFSPAPFGRPCSPGPVAPPPSMLRPPSQPPSPVQFALTPRAAHSAAFVAVAHPTAAATGACDEGATMRSAKRPCVSHAPAASPGRAALPCSPALFRAAPGLGERRMARPFSPAPARPSAPPNAPPSAVRPTALPPRAAACQEPVAFADQGW